MWPGPSMPLRMSSSRRSDPWKGHSWRPRRPNKTREKLLRIAAQFEPRYTCRSPHGNSRRRKGNLNSPGFGAHGPRAVCQSAAVRLRFGALLSLLDPTRIEVSVTHGLLLRQWDSAAAVA